MPFKTFKYRIDFLPKKRNLIIGSGSVLNIAGNYYKHEFEFTKSPFEADKKALGSDWKKVGGDIETATEKFKYTFSKELV